MRTSNSSNKGAIVAAVLVASVLAWGNALAWWNPDWAARKPVTLNTSATGAPVAGSLADVPVLVRLHSGNFPGFLAAAEGGRDLRFMAGDDATPLKYHVEAFDPISELGFVWVRVPTLAGVADVASAQRLWMYFGNPTAATGADAGATFDADYTLVLHFDAAGGAMDATAYQNNPVNSSFRPAPASLIAAGASFDGAGEIRLADVPMLRVAPDKGWTFETWIKPAELNDGAVLVAKGSAQRSLQLRVREGGVSAVLADTDVGEVATAPAAVTVGEWTHLALVVDASTLRLYLNGRPAGEVAAVVGQLGGELVIGGGLGAEPGYVGDLDEVRVSQRARTAEWLGAAAAAQGSDRLVAVGAEEARDAPESSGSGSYFGVILSNVSTDGWVVMGILGVMAVFSWLVMVFKSLALSRVQRDNRSFLADFSKLDAGSLAKLDQAEPVGEASDLQDAPVLQALFGEHDHYQSSNLYRIYHAGMTELDRRLPKAVGAEVARQCMTVQGVATIRATLDAATVRETQKLNSMMVLLTIAISGGPFLGLLGTVMGVMITFAAIAVTGDVNIDAIAPGVSAALMTTVAGLVVAIPALFGYNYLATRVRDMSAAMYVFVDELEARIAEQFT